MKSGFYLRSDGKEIIEIIRSEAVSSFLDIIGYEAFNETDKCDFITDICISDFDRLFGHWIYLGD